MKTISTYCLIVGWIGIMLAMTSCRQENQWDQESAQLITSSEELTKLHHQLDTRVDSLWDATTTILEKQLPNDFPSIDRTIFLNARNADHMKMFKSYELLDSNTKSVIEQAGEYDQKIALQMQDLMQETSRLEKSKNQFLSKVAQSNLKLSRQYADQFRSAANVTMN